VGQLLGERYTHGTWCRRAIEEGLVDTRRAVQLGIRGSLYGSEDRGGAQALGLHLIPTEALLERGVDEVLPEVLARVGKGPVFLSFDIDFVDPGFAPGTGTQKSGGRAAATRSASCAGYGASISWGSISSRFSLSTTTARSRRCSRALCCTNF
jgi:arginase family enzyme